MITAVQKTPYEMRALTRVGYDKAHCKPSDEATTNQWVCALTL
jgi:hypothetical protein